MATYVYLLLNPRNACHMRRLGFLRSSWSITRVLSDIQYYLPLGIKIFQFLSFSYFFGTRKQKSCPRALSPGILEALSLLIT